MSDDKKTHFGYEQVAVTDKADRVAGVFSSVASRYDVMNDVMSLGIHRIWKRIAIAHGGFRPGQKVLDLAGGTGDLAEKMSHLVGKTGHVVLSDINIDMLSLGRDRMIDKGLVNNVTSIQADAEDLPFPTAHFDRVIMSFGLRNVTDKQKALDSIYRVLVPGGRLLVLEFSKPVLPGLKPLYDWYSFKVLPLMGKVIAQDEASYQYLAESIRKHPDQATLKSMMQQSGFDKVDVYNLSGGIVALHIGVKY